MAVIYTEEQEMLRAAARDFLEKECPDSVLKEIESNDMGYSPDLWKKIADLGWLGLIYPEEYGGAGMNLIDLSIIYEEFGRAMFPSPYTSTVVLSGMTILEAGNKEIKESILPEITLGNEIIALIVNELELGNVDMTVNPGIVTIKATEDGEGYIINGSKQFVQHAGIADKYLVPAITSNGSRPEESITLFLIDSRSAGISNTYLDTVSGDSQYEVVLDKVHVSSKDIIGEVNRGWAPLARSLQIATVMSSAQMLGAGQELLELTIEDAEARRQYDAGSVDKYTDDHITDLRRDVEELRQVIYQAASQLEAGESCDFEGTVVKQWQEFTEQNA